ncbi:MAG: protein TolR [Rickettsiales bacterium]|nr:protein TolR [Rickettsiales bacterium]
MSAGTSGGGRRRGRRGGGQGAFSEINVTPMVDVMLVLLIIFMVAAPLLTSGVTVDLPETQAKPLPGKEEVLAISIDPKGDIFVQKEKIPLDKLRGRLQAVAQENKDLRIFVRGDKGVDYGTVMKVIGEINASGLNKVALVSETIGDMPVKR